MPLGFFFIQKILVNIWNQVSIFQIIRLIFPTLLWLSIYFCIDIRTRYFSSGTYFPTVLIWWINDVIWLVWLILITVFKIYYKTKCSMLYIMLCMLYIIYNIVPNTIVILSNYEYGIHNHYFLLWNFTIWKYFSAFDLYFQQSLFCSTKYVYKFSGIRYFHTDRFLR